MPELVMEGECKPVQLEPFVHQVGGHTSMLKFDDTTVCKPLISRERNFYETMPPEMKKFTPRYSGVVEVTFHEDREGYMTLVAYPPEFKKSQRLLSPSSSPSSSGEGAQSDSDSEQNTGISSKQRFRMRKGGNIEVEGSREKVFQLVHPHGSEDKDELPTATAQNPWSLRCHKEQLAKMRQNSKGTDRHKFILLENLASNFKLPCILDLKMGTRQHGDDASEEKRQHQVRKCALTTSSTLGLRLCGMQVYRANTGHYLCHNKYYGRRLSVEGVQDSFFEFLHNGYKLRVDLIDSFLEKLHSLHAMLSKQNTFRFYSSSLLLMYDGADLGPLSTPPPKFDSIPRPFDDLEDSMDSHDSEASTERDSACWMEMDSDDGGATGRSHCMLSAPSHVDVRIIDFAHATRQGFRGDRTVHTGPDTGYLFGLENLIRMLERMKAMQ